jgi:flagellar hook-associated protein 1
MSNILDIGRSGILAYRNALAVTAENIANVGTDGYRRRDVSTVTAGGAQSTAITLPTGGQGVTVTDVRRAFDDLATERARGATASQSAAEAHLAGARAIETLMIPGDDGIDGTLRDFFDSLSRLAGNPTDNVTRALTLGAGNLAAGAVSGLAQGMTALRTDLMKEAAAAARTAQALLQDLAEVSKRMGGLSVPGSPAASAVHPLADRRDSLLDELANLLPVHVTLGDDQRPTVRFGSAAGPLLLEGTRTATLSVSAPDQLTLHIDGADGTARETRALPSGRIGGLSRAIGALDMAAGELDAFARTLADTMNRVHRGGIDQTGAAGGDLFRTDGWDVRPAASNGGTMQIVVTPTATTSARGPIDLTFDGAAGVWRAQDAGGALLASGAERLVLDGATVDLAGRAVNGDRITLTPTEGRAADLALAITDPARLAAASAFATTSAPGNTGAAAMSAVVTGVPKATIPNLGARIGAGVIDLSPGVVGLIPAGTDAVTLSSLGRSATTTLTPLAGATRLDLTLGTHTDGFDLGGLPDASAIAAALTTGNLLSDKGQSLSALGLVATVAGDGALVLSRPGAAEAAGARLTGPAGQVTGSTTLPEDAGGTLQIITRNGKHISGTPLTAAEVQALMTPANGFLEGAVYDPTPLTAAGNAYRGTGIDRLDIPGLQSATLPGAAPVIGTTLPLPAPPGRSLTLSETSGAAVAVDLPAGASAALIAARLDGALPGVTATASTALELSGFAAGPVSFAMAGANGAPLQVSAILSGTDASPLAQAVNALTGATGIRAELSPDGGRLLLVQSDGHDITLSGLNAPVTGGLTAAPAGTDGRVTGPAATWPQGAAIRQAGQVDLTAAQGFGLTEGMAAISSAPGKGATRVQTMAAGAVAALTFRDVPATAEGGLAHRLAVGGQAFEAALPPGATAATIAAALASALRTDAPDAVLTGQPLAALPPEGSALTLKVDGASYSLRMQGGVPVVSGPEAGRITARFDSDNRLVITAPGVTDGTGIGFAPSPAFGLGAGMGMLSLTGQAPDPAGLPATLTVALGGADHILTLGPGAALTVPPGFPGVASIDLASGALRLDIPAPAAGLSIAPVAAAGFGGPGTAVRVEGDRLTLAGRSSPLDLRAEVSGSLGRSLSLTDLPPEDLVVVFTGTGTLRLAGAVGPATQMPGPGALTLEVVDAASGRVALTDAATGHRVAEGALDGAGRVTLAGLTMQMSGSPATGDRFGILPAAAGSANADTALALAALRNPDAATGSPGITERFNRLQGDTGLRASAAARSLATATAAAEASEREQAAIGAVDLDTEAARLLELQQGYQASAQAVSVARDLFDTLLKMF